MMDSATIPVRFSHCLPSHVLLGRAGWLALTFLRSALCGSPGGSNYFTSGSWPNGWCVLTPLNPLSVCLQPPPSSTICIRLRSPPVREDGIRYASLSSPDTRALCRIFHDQPPVACTSIEDTFLPYSILACPAPPRRGLGSLWCSISFCWGKLKSNTVSLLASGSRVHRRCFFMRDWRFAAA
jgi:hypothetical protein